MSRRFAMEGPNSKQLLSYQGKVLVHDDRAELEFLFPGVRVVEPGVALAQYDTLPVKEHPDLGHLEWPLRREDFKL